MLYGLTKYDQMVCTHMLHNFKSLNILHHMVDSVEFGGYANDDNRRAERWMMGSLGTPGDHPWKLLENTLQMCLQMSLTSVTLERQTLQTGLRDDWQYQNGCFFGKVPNGL